MEQHSIPEFVDVQGEKIPVEYPAYGELKIGESHIVLSDGEKSKLQYMGEADRESEYTRLMFKMYRLAHHIVTNPPKSEEFYESLSPGIRKLVRKLNEWGFDTTDSGDGTNYKEGMECAVPYPMVVILLDREKRDPFEETDRLTKLLTDAGVEIGSERVPEYLRWVQLTYSSVDRNCIVTVDNILDSDLT